ncbi:hypothetical protein BDY19DRAFT_312684 [Irpex rosettiformis]|uniref:Uncharacterized protein n=1 Tax=Irpex rosettiformis TaxID=378272 RepID=A0ACB8TZ72_9APHY|nr:hypothetical protein BDY19DRAFT_312684 [Irpex rosettiformis]
MTSIIPSSLPSLSRAQTEPKHAVVARRFPSGSVVIVDRHSTMQASEPLVCFPHEVSVRLVRQPGRGDIAPRAWRDCIYICINVVRDRAMPLLRHHAYCRVIDIGSQRPEWRSATRTVRCCTIYAIIENSSACESPGSLYRMLSLKNSCSGPGESKVYSLYSTPALADDRRRKMSGSSSFLGSATSGTEGS